jgi:hypothetical protein
MRPCSTALAAYLAANAAVVIVDLYTFALTSGEVLRYTGGVSALTVPGAGFAAGSLNAGAAPQSFALGPRFGRSKVTTKIGIEPTELDLDVLAGANDLVGDFSFADAVRIGLFDGATVELDRLFAPPQSSGSGAVDTSLGALLWFYGRVADCDIGRSKISMMVKSLMNLLAIQQMPRRLYGASCTHIFGDPMCGYDRVNGKNALGAPTGIGTQIVTALAGTTQALIVTSFSPTPATAYDQGTIIATSGANSGASRTIAQLSGGVAYLLKPFLSQVVIGDAFVLLPGCDHTVGTCSSTLNNLARHGGFPYIPPPEAAA